MNEMYAAIDEQLDAAFAKYPASQAMVDLRDEIRDDLAAAAQEKREHGIAPRDAAMQAWQEFGDISDLLQETAAEADSGRGAADAEDTTATSDDANGAVPDVTAVGPDDGVPDPPVPPAAPDFDHQLDAAIDKQIADINAMVEAQVNGAFGDDDQDLDDKIDAAIDAQFADFGEEADGPVDAEGADQDGGNAAEKGQATEDKAEDHSGAEQGAGDGAQDADDRNSFAAIARAARRQAQAAMAQAQDQIRRALGQSKGELQKAAREAAQDIQQEAYDQAQAARDAGREQAAQAQALAEASRHYAKQAKAAAAAQTGEDADAALAVDNTMTASLAGVSDITINYPVDDVTLVAGDTDELVVQEAFSTAKRAYYGHLVNEGGTVSVEGGDHPVSSLRVTINGHRFGFWAHITVKIPTSYHGSLTITTESGDVAASQLNLAAPLTIVSEDGDIRLHQLQVGDLTATSEDGDISGDGLTASGEVTLTTEDGDLQLAQSMIAGALTATSESGDVTLIGIKAGQLTVSGDDGDVHIERVKAAADATLTSANGDLAVFQLTSETGALTLSSDDGNVHASLLKAVTTIVASADSGDVTLSQAAAPAIVASASDGDVRGDQLGGAVTLSSESGDVLFTQPALAADVSLSAEDGDVRAKLGPTATFAFDLSSDDGELSERTRQPLRFTTREAHHHVGTVGIGGAATLTATSASGDVSIQA
ncbi:DUF4097 family beta strand repeat-containing protein [Lacticaseibacillus mingshuiensis]|uniref:DUF4097 family beta strand repeat-containing protein n=1 Tax=Lacticaseibacillus mingshuiensis TaxID=2799574 RepID=A0ABW4CJZ5_9LACO|nr:DUF4097 family beta strand repeat-containing protein [Lacticaseibacillus mingshuiensis]